MSFFSVNYNLVLIAKHVSILCNLQRYNNFPNSSDKNHFFCFFSNSEKTNSDKYTQIKCRIMR